MWIKKCEDQIQKLKETRCDTFLLDAKIFYDDKDYLRAKECYQNVVNECGPNYKDAAIWVEICEENIQNKLANIPCGGKVTSCPDQLSKAINENIK